MSGIGWLMTIILGGLAGWIAEKIMKFDTGLLMNIVLGIVGAVVGNFLLGLIGIGLGGTCRPIDRRSSGCLHRHLSLPADEVEASLMVTLLDTVKAKARHPEKANRPDTPLLRKPDWIRVKAPGSAVYAETQKIVRDNKLVTVCEEAGCPNIGECWSKKHATFMIMGDTCTRACAFCNVKTGLPDALVQDEPEKVADAVARMGLSHAVITSVDRDDLDDGGAGHFARTIRAIRAASPATTIEVLTPDFLKKDGALEQVVAAGPGRVQPQSRDRAVALPDHPAGRTLLPLPAPAPAREGTRPRHVHQVRHHGGTRRDA